MENALEALTPGTVVGGKYRITRLVGQGGYGIVYEARNTLIDKRVALKVLHPVLSSDPVAVRRFQQDAKSASNLAHPNIINVLDLGADFNSGTIFIVMEFLDGENLYEYFAPRKRLEPVQAAEILVPVMAALALAHECEIIHRDIKPENIFLARLGDQTVPKLIDFGLSKTSDARDPTRWKTAPHTTFGTPCYMSPEQCADASGVDARTDIWSMGVVLFEMISGVLPFNAPTAAELMRKIRSEPAPRVESLVTGLDPAVAGVIHKALEFDLSQRFASMRAMLDAVLECPGFEHVGGAAPLRRRFAPSIEHRPPGKLAQTESLSTEATLTAAFDTSPPRYAPGDVVGAYTIKRKLGEGGMGAVYEAQRAGLSKRVALKVARVGRNAQAATRFVQEARIAATLDHPNIVDCSDVGQHGDVLYYALEYLEGETLSECLSRGAMDLSSAVDTLLPVCSALATAHNRGVIHRDVKPENIFLAKRLNTVIPKVLDFGLAKMRAEMGGPGLTGTGTVFGTPGYMSPEQTLDSKHVVPGSDQFSLGVVLWECVTRRSLYEGANVVELLSAVTKDPARPVRAVNPSLPAPFESVLARMLERDPTLRYPDMRAVGRALLPFASDNARQQWTTEFGAPTTPDAIATVKAPQRRPVAHWVVALVVVTVMTMIAGYFLRS